MDTLTIEDLHVEVEGKEVIRGVNLEVKKGEIHAIMGPNGSGKSSLALAILGHPKYKVTKGDIKLNGESIINLPTDKRVKKGLFLSMQYPISIPGITLLSLMRASITSIHGLQQDSKEIATVIKIKKDLVNALKLLGLDESFSSRYINEGFSGGEKKRTEIVQMAMIKPKFAILDETDSGLDIDGIKIVSNAIMEIFKNGMGLILITHYNRILKFIRPNYVHVLIDGKIIDSGGPELADQLEEKGYNWLKGVVT
ncbi:MAG: Fe-S cluster assembly ATPase SufC [Thermoproteota archaeon]|nr:Fe-S cluster assembly ATPase SufC [Thermoproteota archaeon]